MRGCRCAAVPIFLGAAESFENKHNAGQSSGPGFRADEGCRAADHDAHRVRLSIRTNLRQLRHRCAPGRRQPRDGGARRGQHARRHDRRSRLSHPRRCPRPAPCAGHRRHAVPLVSNQRRGSASQRRPSGQGGRRRGGEARRRHRNRGDHPANRGGRYSGDGPYRPHSAVDSSHGRLSRAGPQIGRRARMPPAAAR